MRDQAQVLELIIGHAVGMNEVADIDQVGLEQLIERPGSVAAELQGAKSAISSTLRRHGE